MKPRKRHPAEVTADRLTDHVIDWADRIEPAERDEFAHVIHILREIAEDGEP